MNSKIRSFGLLFFSCIFVSMVIYTLSYAQNDKKEEGKLGEFEEEVEEDSNDSSSNEEDNNDLNVGLSFLFTGEEDFIIIPHLFFGPFRDEDSMVYKGNFWKSHYSSYPYQTGREGLFSNKSYKKFYIWISARYFYHNSDLSGFGFLGRFSPLPYVSADIRYTDLSEKLRTRTDHLRLFDVYINYHRVRLSRWAFWWGLGIKGMQGDKTHMGPALNLGTSLYPAKPVSVHLNYNIGSLNHTGVSDFIIRLNFHLKRNMIYIGYQRFTAGSVTIDGPVIGTGIFI